MIEKLTLNVHALKIHKLMVGRDIILKGAHSPIEHLFVPLAAHILACYQTSTAWVLAV